MTIFDAEEILKKVTKNISTDEITYKQYLHKGICKTGPCNDKANPSSDLCCAPFIWCVHASNKLHKLPKHPNCDCYYQDLEIKKAGTISKFQPAPDVWLKMFGKLPDYYITKEEAMTKYGWKRGKDLSKLAPKKIIGGNIYYNKEHILPENQGRIWYECDIDYANGNRNSNRLYYSNDGLMFYSPNHLENNVIVYWVK